MSNIRRSMYPPRSMLASCLDTPPSSPPGGTHCATPRLYPSVEQFRPDPIVYTIHPFSRCLIQRRSLNLEISFLRFTFIEGHCLQHRQHLNPRWPSLSAHQQTFQAARLIQHFLPSLMYIYCTFFKGQIFI